MLSYYRFFLFILLLPRPPIVPPSSSSMKVHRIAIATLISLLSSFSSPSSISLCNGLSASKPPSNNRRKSSFTAKIVEDVVVQEVSAKVNRSSKANNDTKPKPLNARQKSFSQRDPIISLNMVRQVRLC